MLFNLASVIYWRVVTSVKQHQVDIDNFIENYRQVTHDYAVGDQVFVEMTGIYLKLNYKKQGPYRINEVFTNCTVWVQREQVNERINTRQLKPHFNE